MKFPVILLATTMVVCCAIATVHAETSLPDGCATILCPYGSTCTADEDGNAICQCPEVCPAVFDPVCGTDGRTYSNQCELESAACRLGREVTLKHTGECRGKAHGGCRDPVKGHKKSQA